jgi:hypothetical protein
MLHNLFFAAMVFLPFTSIEGVSLLGEIQHEVSAYIFLLMMGISVIPVLSRFKLVSGRDQEKIYLLPRLMLIMLGVIGISFAANVLTIKDSVFLGRSGLEKFISSTIVVFYGFGIAYLTYFLSAKKPWGNMIVKPLIISVAICFVFSFFEMAGRVNGAMATLFRLISAPVYGSFEVLEWDTRLRSVAFEPPDFANTAGYIWPWILGTVLASKGTQRLIACFAFAALNIMILLSEARTSFVIIGGLVLVLVGLLFIFSHKGDGRDPEKMFMPITIIFLMVVPAVLLLLVYQYDRLIYNVVADDNVSNLSRLASITAALRMFEASPVFGQGFGQFGFHVIEFMPAWGYYSYEIRAWLFGNGEFWPAVYSVYARFGADMGILGLFMWVGIWLFLARAIILETMRFRKNTGELPFAAIPLVLSCFCVLFAGIPCDSVRAPMIWVNLGLACRYLASMRAHHLSLSKEKEGAVV